MEDQTEQALLENFAAAVAEATGSALPMPEASGDPRADFVVHTHIQDRPIRFVLEAKRSLFPRDAREAAWQLRNYLAHQLQPDLRETVPVLIAETISPGARKLLREERIGYFDASGSLFLATQGFYVRIDKPGSKRQARSLNNLFAGKRAQALHAVWIVGQDWFGVHEIAERASVSPATASETLIALERREWVESRGAGPSKERRLTNRHALLDAWSGHQSAVKPKPMRHYYVRGTTTGELQPELDRVCAAHGVLYEISGVAAGQIHTPYLSSVSQVTCRMSGGGPINTVLETLEARPVREGWNLGVVEAKSDGELRFHQRVNDLWVSDPLQTYLDLVQTGGRAKELAQHLRAERLEA
ncbi:hypothetical protein BPNPMPFG_006552 (plasmid) [Mesorhizobium sp. AR07]|uniref:type IV toxin-antitoxin system AbiEi family antitoxin n=1 Tax=Mesorhizobium sp. AR07 TaxID=2865838 RepID=UPI00215EC60D|nr:type IV toxin-antitoxin system AbiEi family antitoxin [Mesorhizobium sp. AR07]UVK48934.1 hypothetical protein BPNPMPFG_006552 [Mesorhizobium sp. AR07]